MTSSGGDLISGCSEVASGNCGDGASWSTWEGNNLIDIGGEADVSEDGDDNSWGVGGNGKLISGGGEINNDSGGRGSDDWDEWWDNDLTDGGGQVDGCDDDNAYG